MYIYKVGTFYLQDMNIVSTKYKIGTLYLQDRNIVQYLQDMNISTR